MYKHTKQKAKICSPNSNSHIPHSNIGFTIVELPPSLKFRRASLVPNKNVKQGFTIVELLVVIVVIGILAAITIVSYTGISNKATLASIQSDLNNSSNQLKLYYTEYSSYPATLNTDYCPTAPYSTTKYCLKASSGNTYTYSVATGVTNPQSYSLTATNTSSSTFGVITNNSKPLIPNNTTAPLSPVADWLAIPTGEHYGNFYDSVTKQYASVTRTGPKTIYDPAAQKIYDVEANQLAINPRSDGKSGYEAVIEEGRTNYLLNSSFETGTTLATNWTREYWPAGVALGTLTVDNLANYQTKSQRIQISGTVADTGGYNRIWQRTTIGTFAAGENATASAYIRGTSSGISVFLRLYAYDNSNNNIGNSADSSLALDSSWTRTQITYSNLPVNTSYVELDVFYSGIHNGDSADVYLDSAQIEKGDYATSYIPTTTAIAARNADTVTVPTTGWNQNAMTFFGVSGQISAPSLDHDIIRWPGNTINDRIYLENKNGTYGNSFGWVVLNGSGYNVIGPTKSTSGYMTSALSITPGATAIVYGDAIGGTPVSVVRLGGSLLAYAYVGSYNGLNQEFYNAPIQRLTIYLSALSSSDVSTVTNAIKDGP